MPFVVTATLAGMALRIEPVSTDNFADLEELFGPKGAWSGCWCMWNRQTNAEFQENNYEPNRRLLRQAIAEEQEFGLLAYDGEIPVGWVAVAPRSEYLRLQRSPVTKPVDDRPVWSVTCFVVAKDHREQGVAGELLAAAVARVRSLGGETVEGYPVDPGGGIAPNAAWHGLASMFETAGFTEVARRKPRRPIYRLDL
jgi:GNAT superfamily N-acetyltransferase